MALFVCFGLLRCCLHLEHLQHTLGSERHCSSNENVILGLCGLKLQPHSLNHPHTHTLPPSTLLYSGLRFSTKHKHIHYSSDWNPHIPIKNYKTSWRLLSTSPLDPNKSSQSWGQWRDSVNIDYSATNLHPMEQWSSRHRCPQHYHQLACCRQTCHQ